MQKNFLSILIILFICKYTCSYIVFNLELLPKENYNLLYELNSPKDIISKEIISSYYTEIEVGTDFQKIPLIIKPKLADFVIASIHQMENPEKDYTNNRYVYNLSPNFFQLTSISFYILYLTEQVNVQRVISDLKYYELYQILYRIPYYVERKFIN